MDLMENIALTLLIQICYVLAFSMKKFQQKITVILIQMKIQILKWIQIKKFLKESPTERFLKYMSYIDAGTPNEKVLIIVLLIKIFDEEKKR